MSVKLCLLTRCVKRQGGGGLEVEICYQGGEGKTFCVTIKRQRDNRGHDGGIKRITWEGRVKHSAGWRWRYVTREGRGG
jgi:hypothetical protein